MRAGNNSPSYQKGLLGRKHIHPPLKTNLVNVPIGDQNMAYANSRAMMDLDSFGVGFGAGMPTLPAKAGDEKKEMERRADTGFEG